MNEWKQKRVVLEAALEVGLSNSFADVELKDLWEKFVGAWERPPEITPELWDKVQARHATMRVGMKEVALNPQAASLYRAIESETLRAMEYGGGFDLFSVAAQVVAANPNENSPFQVASEILDLEAQTIPLMEYVWHLPLEAVRPIAKRLWDALSKKVVVKSGVQQFAPVTDDQIEGLV